MVFCGLKLALVHVGHKSWGIKKVHVGSAVPHLDTFFEALVIDFLELLGTSSVDEFLMGSDIDLHDMLKLRMF